MAAGKGMTMQKGGKNYGDFLPSTIESAKGQFTTDELELIQGEAERIHDIGDKLTVIEKKYPAATQEPLDGNMSTPASNGMATPPDDGSMQKLSVFEGKDLDGNTVKSDELLFGNVVTVANFWFTACNPCVGELAELNALNRELTEKSGEIVGVSAFTLDGNKTAISKTKDVLSKKGVTCRNMYFLSDGEAGRFTANVFAYPTTYVVDHNGSIMGDPIVGAIIGKTQTETLQAQINEAPPADMG